MTRVLRDEDADPTLLRGDAVGVLGCGNQGEAQALCLRDAGFDVRVITRDGGPSAARKKEHSFRASLPEDLTELDMEDLLEIRVTSVARKQRDLAHTAAAVTVLSGQETGGGFESTQAIERGPAIKVIH